MVNSVPDSKGQYTGSAHNVGAAHPLGPYAPRSAGKPSGVPGADGQYAHATVKMEPHDKTMSGGIPSNAVPGPDGQYAHADYEGSPRDGGGADGAHGGFSPGMKQTGGGNDAGAAEHKTQPKLSPKGVKPGDGGAHGGVW